MDISPIELLLAKLLPIATQKKISLASLIASDDELRSQFLELLTTEQRRVLKWAWWFWARPNQRKPPGDWLIWFLCGGRAFGKTRSGAEAVREKVHELPGSRGCLIGRSYDDVKKVMVEGESGLLAISPPHDMPIWQPSLKTLTWPNGTKAFVHTSEEPKQLRGPQFHWGWLDEMAAWKFPQETWDTYQMGLRLGDHPQTIITTTPIPLPLLKSLASRKGTILTQGHTFDNAANLPRVTLEQLQEDYGGTRLGAQELGGEFLDANEGALFTISLLAELTLEGGMPVSPKPGRAVVGIDPAEEYGPDNDETGIVVGVEGMDGVGYVVEDLSGRHLPETWATMALQAAMRWNAMIVIETNRGGQMAEFTLRAVAEKHGWYPEIEAVKSKDGKFTRAEPVSALCEKRRARFVGHFAELFKQLVSFVPGVSKRSPDRLDALVIVLTKLFLEGRAKEITPGQKPRGW